MCGKVMWMATSVYFRKKKLKKYSTIKQPGRYQKLISASFCQSNVMFSISSKSLEPFSRNRLVYKL